MCYNISAAGEEKTPFFRGKSPTTYCSMESTYYLISAKNTNILWGIAIFRDLLPQKEFKKYVPCSSGIEQKFPVRPRPMTGLLLQQNPDLPCPHLPGPSIHRAAGLNSIPQQQDLFVNQCKMYPDLPCISIYRA